MNARAILCFALSAPSWIALAADVAPPSPTQAQFGGQCPQGLAEGRHVMTDCSVTWNDSDGRTYCFKNADSKAAFLKDTPANLERARTFVAADGVLTTEKAMQYFDGSDAETLVKAHIAAVAGANGGTFPLEDSLTGEHLVLTFDGIDFTRTIDGYGFFPDVNFHVKDAPDKKYSVDFWIVPEVGQLQLRETRIYRAPQQVDGKWQAVTRQPVPWWWIPASEHPGHVAQKRSWEVMSVVEDQALRQSAAADGIFKLTDDKTGKLLKLKFIDTHQPIRQLDESGHFFACTDFREAGSKDQIYDIDFWLSEKDGKLSIEKTQVHKVPELKNGQWVQVPRYSFKDLGTSKVVP